jgi:hypothetical protein
MALTIGTLLAKAGLEVDAGSFRALDTALTNAKSNLQGLSTESKLAMSATLASVPTAIAAVGAAGLSVASNFEDASTTLTGLYGNVDVAKEKFQNLAAFAANTPFEFPELLDATVKLKAYGIEAGDYLTVLGDTSSAMGKRLNDAVEMLSDAQTGEFERLKEFGVKAVEITKKNAEQLGVSAEQAGMTALTYTDKYGKAQVKVIDRNNREAITAALVGVDGIFQKYTGSMEARSKTLSGMLSTLKDNVSMALADLVGFNMDNMSVQAGSLMGAIEQLVGAGIKLTGWLSDLSEPAQTFLTVVTLAIGGVSLLGAGFIAYGAILPWVTAAQTALGVSLTAALWPVAAGVLALGLLAAGLYVLEEKTGAVSYAFNLFKDILTISVAGIKLAVGMLKDWVVEKFTEIKDAILNIIPESWLNTISNTVTYVTGIFSKFGIDVHSMAETVRADNQDVASSTQDMGLQVGNTQTQVTGATGLMSQSFGDMGIGALNANTQVGTAGLGIQSTMFNTGQAAAGMSNQVAIAGGAFNYNMASMGISAGNMGIQTAAAGTQSIGALNGISGAASYAGGVVVSSTNSMYDGFVHSATGATMANGGIVGLTPAVNGLAGTVNGAVGANKAYAASFVDISNMATSAASAAIKAASQISSAIGSALKTTADQVGNIPELAGKWNTRAKLGISSSGSKGTGEGGVKVIPAKTTNNTTNNTTINVNTKQSSGNVVSQAKRAAGK